MIIIELKYKVPLDVINIHLPAHRLYLERFYFLNKFVLSGPKNPRTGGIIIADTEDIQEVMKIIRQDPFYIYDLAEYNVTEFIPNNKNLMFSNK